MSNRESEHVSYRDAGIIVLTVMVLAVFCQVAGYSLILPIFLLFLGLHVYFIKKSSFRMFLQLGLFLALMVGTTYAILFYTDISPLYIPVASIAMLTALLFNDLQLSFIVAFASSAVMSLVLRDQASFLPLDVMLLFFIGGLTAAYSVRDARTRGKVMVGGLYVSLIQMVCVIVFQHEMRDIFTQRYAFAYLLPLAVNGIICSFVVMATLKIFESMFGVLTNFSLIELSDKDQPLLKRMSLEAPGTYHHSMIVSDISEAAADAIGANALLTRVGAYYHDIGKMVKPEYFTENQILCGNKHDSLEPSISRLVIINHVKEGLEMARKYKLNPLIVDFIPQHHGTSLIHYFYQKALEDASDEKMVGEENYRYPGPKPQSRETAIVLLADSVEAATRALDEPTPQRIVELVHKIINNKFIDGQLDECNLTLKEIDQIAKTFTRVLSAMHHGRIKYPEKKNGSDDRNRKSAEKTSPPPPDDHS